MKLSTIFFDQSNTLRSGWRILAFVALFVALAIVFGILLMGLYFAVVPAPSQSFNLQTMVGSISTLIPALMAGWVCLRLFEKLPFSSLGASFSGRWLKHLLVGLAVGTATICLGVVITMVFGGLQFTLNSDASSQAIISSFVASFFVFLFAAAFEEALFRGYILQTLDRAGYAAAAIILTALPFAIAHLNNPNASRLAALNTFLAGVWFGVAYLKTRDLWFVFGMHFMWNFVLGAVFGIEVSGLKEITPAPILLEIDRGPTWLTGSDYGIEGGIAATFAIMISMGVMLFLKNATPNIASDEQINTKDTAI